MRMSKQMKTELENMIRAFAKAEDDLAGATRHCDSAMLALRGLGPESGPAPRVAAQVGALIPAMIAMKFVRDQLRQGRHQLIGQLRG